MSPQASAHHTFTTFACVRGRLSDRFAAAISLLVALLLVLALIGPGTFLIAKKAVGAPGGLENPVLVASEKEQGAAVSTGQSPDRIGKGTGKDDPDPSPGPKRPRGVLLLNSEVSTVFAVATPGVFELRIEDSDRQSKLVSVEAAPKDDALPQELLRRPPPEK